MVKNFSIVLKKLQQIQKNCFKNSNSQNSRSNCGLSSKIADKIANASKKSLSLSQNNDAIGEIKEPKKRCISPEERQQIIDELRLV